MTDIQSLKSSNFDFVQALEEAMDKADTSAAVRAIVIEAIEKGKL
jgi:enoyl-CoA hydratase/carnithine racemase